MGPIPLSIVFEIKLEMNKSTLIASFLLGSAIAQAQTTDVLFLGNSYVYTGDLPGMFYNLAQSGGDPVYRDSNAPGGYTLQGHSTNSTSLAKINERDWNFVVLQEQSQMPSFPPSQVAAQVYPYAAILVDSIRANNPCTEPVFFMTWGRKYGDAQNCPNYTPLCTYNGMQARLRQSYLQMGLDNSATVAPCGVAWKNCMTADPDSLINLYSGDNSHPSTAGTYLNACVFYATIFRKSPVGYTYHGGLPQATAEFLQQIAAATVLDSMAVWRIGANDPQASFTTNNNGLQFQFNETSLNATSHYWEFGDGTTASSPSPTHTYTQGGIVTVMYVAANACTSDTTYQTIDLDQILAISGPQPALANLVRVADGLWELRSNAPLTACMATLTDFAGRVVWQQPIASGTTVVSIPLPVGLGVLALQGVEINSVWRVGP